jgi:hypothetical protein
MIKKAIIIHGPGRSGTTLLNSIISSHPSLGWVSGYLNKFPRYSRLSYLNRICNIHFFKTNFANSKFFPKSVEAYHFWNYYLNDFNLNIFDNEKISSRGMNTLIDAIEKILYYSNKKRILIKITGASRDQVLKKIFFKPYILYIKRDPRAVVYSYFKQHWGYKNDIKSYNDMTEETLIAEYCNKYIYFYNDRKKLMKKYFNFFEVSYEKLIKHPMLEIERLFNIIELDFDQDVQKYMKTIKFLDSTNNVYLDRLSKKSINIMEEKLEIPILEMNCDKID